MKPLLATLLLLLAATSIGSLHASAAGAEFNAADAKLNQVYKKLLGSIDDPAQKALLVSAQKAWLKDRDANVALFAARYEYSKGGLFYNLYMVQERTKFLQALLDNAGGEAEGPTEYMGQ